MQSYAQYPAVFQQFMAFRKDFEDVSVLDTRTFLQGLKLGQEVSIELEHGKTLFIKLHAVGEVDATGHRDVIFGEHDGHHRARRACSDYDLIELERISVPTTCSYSINIIPRQPPL